MKINVKDGFLKFFMGLNSTSSVSAPTNFWIKGMVVLRCAWKLFQSVGDIDESIRFDLGGKVTFVLVPLELSAKILVKN